MDNLPLETKKFTIAVVDDEEDLRCNVAAFLGSQGFNVWTADSAESFYRQRVISPADLVIVDLGLPGEGGLDLIAYLHAFTNHAVIALTARGSLSDRISGLEAGSDYYFVKPVDLYELKAAINAVLRKKPAPAQPFPQPPQQNGTDIGMWEIMLGKALLIAPNGTTVPLTTNEMQLLEILMGGNQSVFSKDHLLELFGLHFLDGDFHRIEVLMSRLRSKVFKATHLRLPLRSVFGKGIAFTVPSIKRNSPS